MAERYKIGDIDNERFYQMPKSLFTNPKYKPMTTTAKIIYAILKDRMELSRKNGWTDENGDIYLMFSQESIAELLGVNNSTAYRGIKELAKAKASVKGRFAFYTGFLYIQNKIAHSQSRKSFATL